ncbi:DNA-binding response regulator, NarL/FixJ family, contains REC and HTH domains [Streptoalloteichus tenebrarius]|uniref:DNA-binding response regulator, NarL/FixJ family, contains REC and HTH domains n=1 Tax=Streptoalloteichus tenebrarius (strain ATCC 17920 / DSM 40477 / JCM 4838 / CBS 697.72 / NBRC 16177 / NCIMB 11028 / NRRL B-12390 / A12253. 1 / ISP 5477) TaxID=1933 RepID=A0ABT1HPV6_STRSD|nr:DNA-binding response regulator, NarL/FixJ family, contains REC and HTH domains [Streptoalloteichus tenebrarius]BFE98497.1 response regulator transcription factor [Streptoalloteichus tenebrarius]
MVAVPVPSEEETIRVLVVDDQQAVREGLAALVGLTDGLEVVGQAGDGAEAVRLAAETAPHVVLMDLRMPIMDGVEATARLRRDHPGVAVLVLSTYADQELVVAALSAGARGYLTKEASRTQIETAIRSCAHGQSTLDAAVSARLVASLPGAGAGAGGGAGARWGSGRRPLPDGLTRREGDVLVRIARGLTNREIARELCVEESTVKTHINNAFAKIGARTRSDAVRYAYRQGLVEP